MIGDRDTVRKHAITAFDALATEHDAGHQDKYARRYVISGRDGKFEVMLEVSDKTPLNVWVEANAISPATAQGLGMSLRTGSSTYADPSGKYGSHSALQKMNSLHRGDAYKVAIESVKEFYAIFDAIRGM